MVFARLDRAGAKHDFCLRPTGSDAPEFGTLAHQPDVIEGWAHALHQRLGVRFTIPLLPVAPQVVTIRRLTETGTGR